MEDFSQEEQAEWEKIIEESNQIIVDIMKVINSKNISAVIDALARAVSMTACHAVLSNIIDISQREKLIDNIGNSAKLYLTPEKKGV